MGRWEHGSRSVALFPPETAGARPFSTNNTAPGAWAAAEIGASTLLSCPPMYANRGEVVIATPPAGREDVGECSREEAWALPRRPAKNGPVGSVFATYRRSGASSNWAVTPKRILIPGDNRIPEGCSPSRHGLQSLLLPSKGKRV
jgi:hypothetical protein